MAFGYQILYVKEWTNTAADIPIGGKLSTPFHYTGKPMFISMPYRDNTNKINGRIMVPVVFGKYVNETVAPGDTPNSFQGRIPKTATMDHSAYNLASSFEVVEGSDDITISEE